MYIVKFILTRRILRRLKQWILRESFWQGDRTVAMSRIHRLIQMSCSSLVFRFLGYVMEHSWCLMFLAEKLREQMSENTERQKLLLIRGNPKFLREYLKRQSAGWVISIIFQKLHRDLRFLHIQQTVLWQQPKMKQKSCMQSSSIQRYSILLKEQRWSIIL